MQRPRLLIWVLRRLLASMKTSPKFAILSVLLLVMLILAAVRVTSIASSSNDQLVLKIGNQQQALVDLRQSIPISPYLFGVNVFPETGTDRSATRGKLFLANLPNPKVCVGRWRSKPAASP